MIKVITGNEAAAERNEDIIYVCYDNQAYQNTGNHTDDSPHDLERIIGQRWKRLLFLAGYEDERKDPTPSNPVLT